MHEIRGGSKLDHLWAPSLDYSCPSLANQCEPWATESWCESYGDYRVVACVEARRGHGWAVTQHIQWREVDTPSAVWAWDPRTGTRLSARVVSGATSVSGQLSFELPSWHSLGNCYHLYYRPYQYQFTWWCGRFEIRYAVEGQATAKDAVGAVAGRVEARTAFDERPWVEDVATPEEIVAWSKHQEPQLFAVGIEDAFRDTLRFRTRLPRRWLRNEPVFRIVVRTMHGQASTVVQLALWNPTSHVLQNVSVRFLDESINSTCINLEGVDMHGKSLRYAVSVPSGIVQPFFVLVQAPPQHATAVVTWQGGQREAKLIFDQSASLQQVTDFEDLTTLRRLEWLNSKVGHNSLLTAPYEPLELSSSRDRFRATTAELTPSFAAVAGAAPLLEAATALGGRRQIALLDRPITLRLETDGGGTSEWNYVHVSPSGVRGVWGYETKLSVRGVRMSMSTRCMVHYDGYVGCRVTLGAVADGDSVELDDVVLEVPLSADASAYAFGLDRFAGSIEALPEVWRWRDNAGKANNVLWVGNVDGGLWMQLGPDRGEDSLLPLAPQWRIPDDLSSVPWAGDGGEGYISVGRHSGILEITAHSGPILVSKARTWALAMMVTPVKPRPSGPASLCEDVRYMHTRYGEWAAPDLDTVSKLGASVVVLHQGNSLNPYINYPFEPTVVSELRTFTAKARARKLRVKLYYTVRELSVRAIEIFALRSLGHEILLAEKPESHGAGASWLKEHLDPDLSYSAAWYTRLAGGEDFDQALENNGSSRWANYYLEGLNWLLNANDGPLIDGLYLDGLAYDRDVLRRLRRIADAERPNGSPSVLVDLHSGPNNYQHVSHMPYVDSLWVGEKIDYSRDPNYWLVVVSGITWGLPSQTLGTDDCTLQQTAHHGCAAFFKGLVFGLTNRCGWNGLDPNHNRAIWKLLDDFGAAHSDMIGWWDAKPVVHAILAETQLPEPLVKTTALVRRDRLAVLVFLASWHHSDLSLFLRVDWTTLDLEHMAQMPFLQPELEKFQPSAPPFAQNTALQVAPHGGGVFVVDARS